MEVIYKIPKESKHYPEWSEYIIHNISEIMRQAIEGKNNLIFLRTNLRRGLPLENINKVAGPFVEAWAVEQFELVAEEADNKFDLINVAAGKRLDAYDIVLQFKRKQDAAMYASADVDVKATSQDIVTSGKSPNITSYARIRTEYVDDPDYIFIILSLKYKVYGEKDLETALTNGIMEIVSYAVYDLKYLSAADISYNPALGTGQIQIRDIHYVSIQKRTTWEFLRLLDEKFTRSQGELAWLKFAKKYKWVKDAQ